MGATLPEAPALNLSNPAVGAASGFASSASHAYAAGLQFASALRDTAARQQQAVEKQKFDQQQADQKATNEYAIETQKYRAAGATPSPQYDVEPRLNNAGTPKGTMTGGAATLKRDQSGVEIDPTLAADNPNHTQIDSRGKAWHYPDQGETAAAKANGFIPSGGMADALEQHGIKPGANGQVPWAQAGTLLEKLGLAVPTPESQTINTQDFSGADGNPATMAIGNRTGKATPVSPPAGMTQNPQTSKGATQDMIPGGKGANGGILVRDAKTGAITEQKLPPGASLGLTPGQEAVAGRSADARADRQQRASEAAQTRADAKDAAAETKGNAAITALQSKEQDQHELRRQIGLALAAENGEQVIDPTSKSGKDEVELTPARRAFFQSQYDQATEKARNYHEAQRKIVSGRGGTPAAPLDLGPAATPAPAPKKGAPAPAPAVAPEAKPLASWDRLATPVTQQQSKGKGKLTDPATAKGYVQKAGGDKVKARALAKADGWEF